MFHSEKPQKDQAEHASIYWATPDAVEGKYNINLRETSANVYYDGGAGQWMAAIDVPSLDVWDMLYVKLNEAAHVLYQDENGVELERSSDLVGHTGEKDQLLYKRNHCQLFEERLRTSREWLRCRRTTEL